MARPIVELSKIEKDYGSGSSVFTVLGGLDLCIEEGEFVGIVGASGSGKTTLMNILGCLDRPSRGTYRLAGEDVSSLSDDRLSQVRNDEIGFVFQSFNLITQLTVLENAELPMFYQGVPRRERRRRSQQQLDAVGLSHRLDHYPTQLSGGECQRVAIARSLVNEPALLLTDEPTGNLDSVNGDEVLRMFHDLHAAGRTIVMVTHNPQIADELPRVLNMADGHLTYDTGPYAGARTAAAGPRAEAPERVAGESPSGSATRP